MSKFNKSRVDGLLACDSRKFIVCFVWLNDDEIVNERFDFQKSETALLNHNNNIHEENVIKVSIQQNENEMAIAVISILDLQQTKTHALLYVEILNDDGTIGVKPIFVGKFACVSKRENNLYDICFTAIGNVTSNKLTFDQIKYRQIMPELTEWNRFTGEAHESEYNSGRRALNIPLDKLIKYVEEVDFGVQSLNVIVTAKWLRSTSILYDLYSQIRLGFQNGTIKTCTPDALINRWPQDDEFINGKQDYYVISSNLDAANESAYSLNVKDTDYSIPIIELEGDLTVQLLRNQNMHEQLIFRVDQYCDDNFIHLMRDETLAIDLGDVAMQYPEWKQNKNYEKGDKIYYCGIVYHIDKTHISGERFEDDRELWLPNQWKENTQYQINDVVEREYCSYVAIQNHISIDIEQLNNRNLWHEIQINDGRAPCDACSFFCADSIERQSRIQSIITCVKRYIDCKSRIMQKKISVSLWSKLSNNHHVFDIQIGDILNIDAMSGWPIGGKVSEYQIEITHDTQLFHCKTLSSAQKINSEQEEILEQKIQKDDLVDHDQYEYIVTNSISHKLPKIILASVVDDFTANVVVENSAEAQIAQILDSSCNNLEEIKSVLRKNPTKIAVKFNRSNSNALEERFMSIGKVDYKIKKSNDGFFIGC
jgi:hypothetical protein